jgi:hypothetical protein
VSEVSVGGDTWTESAAVLENRANSAEKQVKSISVTLEEGVYRTVSYNSKIHVFLIWTKFVFEFYLQISEMPFLEKN